MEDESALKLVKGGNHSQSHKKKNKNKRVSVEESVAAAEEATPRHKKKRAEKKKELVDDDQIVKEDAGETHPQLVASAKQVSPLGTPNDPESRPKEKKKRQKRIKSDENVSVKTGKKCKQGPAGDELENDANRHAYPSTTSMDAVEPTNDDKSEHQDASILRSEQETKTTKALSTNLRQDLSNDETHTPEKPSKRKRKHKHEGGGSTPDTGGPDNIEKKKRKHKELTLDATQAEASEPKLKKKSRPSRRDSDRFPDPNEDTNLTDSARRALAYVHAQILSHSDWKFNKARQNWVVRNMWDDKVIPDTYFPSCVKYLVSVRGNTREILIKESELILDSSASQPDPVNIAVDKAKASGDDQGVGEAGAPGDQRQMRFKRAQMTLLGLGHDPRREQ